jgi:MFS family permease
MRRPLLVRPPAFAYYNYRLYFLGFGTSVVGTWMQTLGQAWLVLQLTPDPFILGLVVACQGIPVAALGLFGGVITDRMDKRRLILMTQVTMLVLALGLGTLTLTGLVQVWHIALFALATASVFAIDMPARHAFISEMVGPNDVGSAVALNSTVYSVGRLIGPAVAGIVIALATAAMGDPVAATGVAFFANAASYVAVLGSLAGMRTAELLPTMRVAGPREAGAILREIREGLRFVRASPYIRTTLFIPGLIATVAINFGVFVPVMAKESGLDASGLGIMLAAPGLGALLAATFIGFGGNAGARVILAGAVLVGAAEFAIGFTAAPPLVLALLFCAGAGATGMRASANTQIQVNTPAHLRGRVMSIFAMIFEGASPAGGLLAGALAGAVGGRTALGIVGAVAILLAATAAPVLLARREAERAPA